MIQWQSVKQIPSKSSQFEYRIVWNWKQKNAPALHMGYYDKKATNHSQAINRTNEVLAEWAGIENGATIVDAGCGLGHSSVWLAQNYNAKVTGITIVPKQVTTIQKFVTKNNINNVSFLIADYLQMPFDDCGVDLVWAVESVCHASDKLKFYKEAFRILKPGSKLVIGEYMRVDRPLEKKKEELLKEIFNGWAIPDLDTPVEHQSHAFEAGFITVKTRDVTANMMISYKNLVRHCRRVLWLSKFLHSTRIISALRHKNLLSSLKQVAAIEQGIFTYHQLVAQK